MGLSPGDKVDGLMESRELGERGEQTQTQGLGDATGWDQGRGWCSSSGGGVGTWVGLGSSVVYGSILRSSEERSCASDFAESVWYSRREKGEKKRSQVAWAWSGRGW